MGIELAIGAIVASTAASLYTGNQQRIAASQAADQADEAMRQQQQAAQQALDAQNKTAADNLAQAQAASDAQIAAAKQANDATLAQQQATADSMLKQQQDASAASIAVQQQALQASQQATLTTQTMQTEAINRANAKTPDVAALLSANQQAAKGGAGSTMLTGTQGVDPSTLSLSKSSLLGA